MVHDLVLKKSKQCQLTGSTGQSWDDTGSDLIPIPGINLGLYCNYKDVQQIRDKVFAELKKVQGEGSPHVVIHISKGHSYWKSFLKDLMVCLYHSLSLSLSTKSTEFRNPQLT